MAGQVRINFLFFLFFFSLLLITYVLSVPRYMTAGGRGERSSGGAGGADAEGDGGKGKSGGPSGRWRWQLQAGAFSFFAIFINPSFLLTNILPALDTQEREAKVQQ